MNKQTVNLIISMCIFGTVGLVRRFLPYSSALVATVRGVIGTLFLLLVHICKKEKFDRALLRQNFWRLLFSGAMIGFNWILLFEALNYTSVAVATVCYYMAPVFVLLAAPVLLHERLTVKKGVCAAVAVLGAVLVSGVLEEGFSGAKGIALALGAAVLYAGVMLLNKKIVGLSANDRTFYQLFFTSMVLLPYLLLTEDVAAISWEFTPMLLLLLVGVVHTGFAYSLYFGSFRSVPAQAVAIFSYIDPAVAVLLSALVLHEPLSPLALLGVVLVLLGTMASELDFHKK